MAIGDEYDALNNGVAVVCFSPKTLNMMHLSNLVHKYSQITYVFLSTQANAVKLLY